MILVETGLHIIKIENLARLTKSDSKPDEFLISKKKMSGIKNDYFV